MNNNLLKNLGVILIILGTLILVLSYFCNWVDYNWISALAMLSIIGGIISHIVLNKKILD